MEAERHGVKGKGGRTRKARGRRRSPGGRFLKAEPVPEQQQFTLEMFKELLPPLFDGEVFLFSDATPRCLHSFAVLGLQNLARCWNVCQSKSLECGLCRF